MAHGAGVTAAEGIRNADQLHHNRQLIGVSIFRFMRKCFPIFGGESGKLEGIFIWQSDVHRVPSQHEAVSSTP